MCECWTEKIVVGTELTKGKTQSCGCLRTELRRAPKTHGMSYDPFYAVWRSMLARCLNPRHKAYGRYGGRGVTVCESWLAFDNFKRDMYPTYQSGLTLDRTDNNGSYSKENCRWVCRKAQARNKRSNRYIDTPNGRMLICEAAELSGINMTTLCYRVGAGWPAERMFDTPDTANRVVTS